MRSFRLAAALTIFCGVATASVGCGKDDERSGGGDEGSPAESGESPTDGSSLGGAGGEEHQNLTHAEHAALAPSPEHLAAKEEHLASTEEHGPLAPAPAPLAERQLFATGDLAGADGHLWTYDPYCRIEDDGKSCPDSWAVCGYDRCSTWDPIAGFNCPGCETAKVIALDEVDDPCGLWSWDKTIPEAWALRAADSFEMSNTLIQEIVVGESGNSLGYESCRASCLSQEDCIGGMMAAFPRDPDWTAHCILLTSSAEPLIREAEPRFPLTFSAGVINNTVEQMFTPPWTLNSNIFSVCRDPQAYSVMEP